MERNLAAEKGKYFTIKRARQYGKTTTLYLLEEKMKTSYLVLSLSFHFNKNKKSGLHEILLSGKRIVETVV